MDKHDYLRKMLEMHEALYNVERMHSFGGLVFDGYAEYHAHASQYVLARRAKLWGANTHDYAFFKAEDLLTLERAQGLFEFMKTRALDKVEINPEHMTSYLTLVIVADKAEDEACELIRRARFRKNFTFGFRGWADVRMALADLSSCRIIANKQGAEIADALQRCMEKD